MGVNHMSDQLRNWSPGQAMLPPDPNHHNRMLDRVAAEHLREVAPGLAPCLSCQAGLCAEHGPTVTATTTGAPASCGHDHSKEVGERDGITLEPRLLLAVPLAPAPPADAKHHEEDCVCRKCRPELHSAQPPAEATNPIKTLSALLLAGSAKLVTRITPSQACDVVREIARQNGHDVVIEAPAPEATGESLEEDTDELTSEEIGLRNALEPFYRQGFYAGQYDVNGNREMVQEHADRAEEALKPVLAAWVALRTRAREAEEREAKWRRELSAACELSERAREIVVSALNQPPEHFYDKHDNGEWSAEHIAFAIRSLFRERDEAREQLAKETERADDLVLAVIAEPNSGKSRERFNAVCDAFAALSTRAREAEERAEKTTEHLLNSVAKAVRRGDELESERDEARQEARWLAEVFIATGHATPDIHAWLDRAKHCVGTLRESLTAANERVDALLLERDEAREQRDDLANEILAGRSDLAAANARAEEAERKYDRLRDISLCRRQFPDGVVPGGTEECARGWHDWYEKENAARLRAEAERDGALTEANDLRLRVERLVEGAAKLTERAEEAEEEWRLADFRVKSAESRSDDFAARLAAAEAEVKRLRLAWDDPEMDATDGAHPAWWRGNDAGVAGAVRIVNEALDEALPLAGCVGGADLERVRQRIAALRERAERLVRAGDEMVEAECYDWPHLVARWKAAKETK